MKFFPACDLLYESFLLGVAAISECDTEGFAR